MKPFPGTIMNTHTHTHPVFPCTDRSFTKQKSPAPGEAEDGASAYYPARVLGALHAHSQLAVQVDDGVVDEGEDPQLELGLAGVAILDHAGVGVGNRAAEGRNVKVSYFPGCYSGTILVNICLPQPSYSLHERLSGCCLI